MEVSTCVTAPIGSPESPSGEIRGGGGGAGGDRLPPTKSYVFVLHVHVLTQTDVRKRNKCAKCADTETMFDLCVVVV